MEARAGGRRAAGAALRFRFRRRLEPAPATFKLRRAQTVRLCPMARERPYSCEVEGYGYAATTRSKLVLHIRAHTGERPYSCAVEGCDYTATQRGHLVVHSRTHTGERPFSCEVEGCGFSATVRSGIVAHIRRKHAAFAP
jgi:insecticidal toxin complex protein TccC